MMTQMKKALVNHSNGHLLGPEDEGPNTQLVTVALGQNQKGLHQRLQSQTGESGSMKPLLYTRQRFYLHPTAADKVPELRTDFNRNDAYIEGGRLGRVNDYATYFGALQRWAGEARAEGMARAYSQGSANVLSGLFNVQADEGGIPKLALRPSAHHFYKRNGHYCLSQTAQVGYRYDEMRPERQVAIGHAQINYRYDEAEQQFYVEHIRVSRGWVYRFSQTPESKLNTTKLKRRGQKEHRENERAQQAMANVKSHLAPALNALPPLVEALMRHVAGSERAFKASRRLAQTLPAILCVWTKDFAVLEGVAPNVCMAIGGLLRWAKARIEVSEVEAARTLLTTLTGLVRELAGLAGLLARKPECTQAEGRLYGQIVRHYAKTLGALSSDQTYRQQLNTCLVKSSEILTKSVEVNLTKHGLRMAAAQGLQAGQKVEALTSLTKTAQAVNQTFYKKEVYTGDSIKAHFRDLNTTLEAQGQPLKVPRHAWKPLLANLAVCLTGVGLVVVGLRAGYHLATGRGSPLLFSKTKSERAVESGQKTMATISGALESAAQALSH